MTKVHKIFGPPGTGKTTRLLRIVEEAMAAGVRPEQIAFTTFTRKAANEAAERAQDKFQIAAERFPHFKTLHAIAFRDVYARRDDIMQEEEFQQLGRMLGFRFTTIDMEASLMPNGTALGDRVARLEALSRVRMVPLQQQWEESGYKDVNWLAVENWADNLSLFKRSRGMMDYTDLLEQFDQPLDVELFIVDEAQDLSALQWRVVDRASAKAKHLYIAGDDDQCIYEWAGADINHFLQIEGTTEVLPVSFRLPRTIHEVAENVAHQIRIRQPKVWQSRDEEGVVHYGVNEDNLDFGLGKWLLLARNHVSLLRYQRVLENRGYVYICNHTHSTNNSTTNAILSWERWRKGNPLKPADVKAIAAYLPALENWRPREDVYLEDAPLDPRRKKQEWIDALEIQPRTREYLRACLANREKISSSDARIIVSTIHQAKGGEADHVVLLPDVTKKPWEQLDTDSEYRVLYVAVTRAKQSLTICKAQSRMRYKI